MVAQLTAALIAVVRLVFTIFIKTKAALSEADMTLKMEYSKTKL
jgi:hypothetical protein